MLTSNDRVRRSERHILLLDNYSKVKNMLDKQERIVMQPGNIQMEQGDARWCERSLKEWVTADGTNSF